MFTFKNMAYGSIGLGNSHLFEISTDSNFLTTF